VADIRKVSDLQPDKRNANKGTERGLKALDHSLRQYGAGRSLLVDKHGRIIAGNKTAQAAADIGLEDVIVVHTDGTKLVAVQRDDLDLEQDKAARELAYADNRVGQLDLEWDIDNILADMEAGVDLSAFFDTDALTEAVQGALNKIAEEDTDTTNALKRGDVPDALWPTDNEWGIPLLDIHKQADAVDMPVRVWNGSGGGRGKAKAGTWHFYTTDDRFNALWDNPAPVVNSGPVNIVEPNFSCWLDMPLAFGLFQIYRKRWLARYWQSKGIRAFVDMNVAPPFYALNLLGVPQGWRAYATRGYSDRLDYIDQEHAQACERAGGSDVLFLVYGGGKAVKARCRERGWVWVTEDMDRAKGREVVQDA
jgi:hypothetical protein